MFIKPIAFVAASVASFLSLGAEAQARVCLPMGPGHLCNDALYRQANREVYHVGYANGSERFNAEVHCDNRNLITWSGKKWNMTEDQVRWVVTEFCALPN